MVSGMRVDGLSDDYSGYDPETGIRTFLLTQHYMDVDVTELLGNKITLIADHGLKNLEPVEYNMPLELTDTEVMTVRVERGRPTDHAVEVPFDGFGYGSTAGYESWTKKEEYSILTPGDEVHQLTKELSVTGIAFADGQLHVQTRSSNAWTSGEVWLIDKNGEGQYAKMFNSFQIDDGVYAGYYKEDVFDITETELENYTLQVVVQSHEQIDGPWKVTFEFTESDYEGDVVGMETEVPVME